MNCTRTVRAAAAAIVLAAPACAWAQTGKPIRFIVGFPPGGAVDLIARAVAPGIGQALGTTVVVDNRAGASGGIGAELLAKSPADGSAIGLVSITSLVLNVHMAAKPPYHPLKDFTAVTTVGTVPFAIATHPAVPARSLRDLIAIARAGAHRVTVGSPGQGSLQHLTVELLNRAAKVQLLHVPYKGTGPALTDVMGGHIDGMVTAIPGMLAAARSGRLRVLAVTSDKRAGTLPEVPTAIEQGYKDFVVVNWYAIVAPAGMAAAPLDALHKAVVTTTAAPGVREKLLSSGVDPKTDASPASFAAYLGAEFERWGTVVRQTGVRRN